MVVVTNGKPPAFLQSNLKSPRGIDALLIRYAIDMVNNSIRQRDCFIAPFYTVGMLISCRAPQESKAWRLLLGNVGL